MTETAPVDSVANKQEPQQAAQPDFAKELADLKEMNTHLKGEVQKYKNEAKQAFEKRDKKVEEVSVLKDQDKLVAYAETLKADKENLEKQLQEIKIQAERKAKMELVQKTAKEHGLKDRYAPMLEKLINLDEVDVSKPITTKYAIEAVKNDIPDFFGMPGADLDKSIPSMKPVAGTKALAQAEYDKIKNNPNRTAEDTKRAFELAELLQKT